MKKKITNRATNRPVGKSNKQKASRNTGKKTTQSVAKAAKNVKNTIIAVLDKGPTKNRIKQLTLAPAALVRKYVKHFMRMLAIIMRTFIRKRNRRSCNDNHLFLLTIMSLLVLSIHSFEVKRTNSGFTVKTSNGTYETKIAKIPVPGAGICSWIGNGMSSVGTKNTERCVHPMHDAPASNVRCWCTEGTTKITFYMHPSHSVLNNRRGKRSIATHPAKSTGNNGGVAYIQERFKGKEMWRVEHWYKQNYMLALILTGSVFYWTKKRSYALFTFIAVGLVGSTTASTACIEVSDRDIVESVTGSVWVDVHLIEGSCTILRTEHKPTITLELGKAKIMESEKDREFALECMFIEKKSDDSCPGASPASLPEEADVSWTCKRDTVFRGWGDGCFLFENGEVVTCIKLDCPEPYATTWNPKEDTVQYEVTAKMVTGSTEADLISETAVISYERESAEVNLQQGGKITLDCKPKVSLDYNNHQILVVGEASAHSVSIDWANNIPLPWRYTGGLWKNRQSMLSWGVPTPTSIPLSVLADQTGALEASLSGTYLVDFHDNGTIVLEKSSLSCRIKTTDLKAVGGSNPSCAGTVEIVEQMKVTHIGTVVVTIKYKGNDVPCALLISVNSHPDVTDGKGGYPLNDRYMAEISMSQITLEFKIWPGEVWIKIQDQKMHWIQEGSMVSEVMQRTFKNAAKLVDSGATTWGYDSIGTSLRQIPRLLHTAIGGVIDTIFGGSSRTYMILLGLAVIWLGTQQRYLNNQLIFYVVGASVLLGSMGVLGESIGCGIDSTRMSLKCGNRGEFIWKDLQNTFQRPSYRPSSDSSLEWLLTNIKDKDDFCIGALGSPEMDFAEDMITALDFDYYNITLNVRAKFGKSVMINYVGKEAKHIEKIFVSSMWQVNRATNPQTTIHVMETGHPDFFGCKNKVTFNLEAKGFAFSLTDIAYADVTPLEKFYCSDIFSSVLVKNNRAIFADDAIWMESTFTNSTGEISRIDMVAYRECYWPAQTTVWKTDKSDTQLFIPIEIGGPRSNYNFVSGYSNQYAGPWHLIPLTATRGFCPGTNVVIDSGCSGRKASARSTDGDGKIISQWCCRKCTLPPIKFETTEGCWYPMEVQPVKSKKIIRSNYFAPSGTDTPETVELRADVVWSSTSGENVVDKKKQEWTPLTVYGVDAAYTILMTDVEGTGAALVKTKRSNPINSDLLSSWYTKEDLDSIIKSARNNVTKYDKYWGQTCKKIGTFVEKIYPNQQARMALNGESAVLIDESILELEASIVSLRDKMFTMSSTVLTMLKDFGNQIANGKEYKRMTFKSGFADKKDYSRVTQTVSYPYTDLGELNQHLDSYKNVQLHPTRMPAWLGYVHSTAGITEAHNVVVSRLLEDVDSVTANIGSMGTTMSSEIDNIISRTGERLEEISKLAIEQQVTTAVPGTSSCQPCREDNSIYQLTLENLRALRNLNF